MDKQYQETGERRKPIDEVALGLCWEPGRLVGMLWAYFDESGEHQKDGSYKRLAVAGCVAPIEAWQSFSEQWALILKVFEIDCFHMAEFEPKKQGFKSKYKGWDAGKKKLFLNLLLELIKKLNPIYIGFKEEAEVGVKAAKPIYWPNVNVIVPFVSAIAEGRQISFVFAQHPEIPAPEIHAYCDVLMRHIPNLRSCTVGRPIDLPPLQAADLFAFEYSHCKQWDNPFVWRYPFKRLRSTNPKCFVWPQP